MIKNIVLLAVCITFFDYISALSNIVQQQTVQSIVYCPWREPYEEQKKKKEVTQNEKPESCVFCMQIASGHDEKYFIIRRYTHHVLMLNAFPVTKGHLLILPYDHVAFLADLSQEARQELMEIISSSVELIKQTLRAQGVNVGFNLGAAAGAGIPGHVHGHIVPRYISQASFSSIIGSMRFVPWNMQQLYVKLKEAFQ